MSNFLLHFAELFPHTFILIHTFSFSPLSSSIMSVIPEPPCSKLAAYSGHSVFNDWTRFLPRCINMQGCIFDHKAVRLSVKRVSCDKTKELLHAQTLISHERSIDLILRHEEWLVGTPPSMPEILSQIDPPPSKTAISNRYSLVAPQP